MSNSENQAKQCSSATIDEANQQKDDQDVTPSTVELLLKQLEELLKSTEVGSKLHQQLTRYMDQLKPLVNEPNGLADKSKDVVKKINDFLHENPLLSAGIAAGAGVLLTMLLNSKKK